MDKYHGKARITMGDGKSIPISHVGTANILATNGKSILLKNVLHSPNIFINLLSVSQLTTHNNVYV